MAKRVLLVCSGNLCRSPYAEYRLRELCPDIEVASVGLEVAVSGLNNKRADRTAVTVARESGIDLRRHRATPISSEWVDWADVILVMERQQVAQLCLMFPCASHKVFLFGVWNDGRDIRDPYRQAALVFRQIFLQLDDAAEAWSRRL